jgi:hypothetical protein
MEDELNRLRKLVVDSLPRRYLWHSMTDPCTWSGASRLLRTESALRDFDATLAAYTASNGRDDE